MGDVPLRAQGQGLIPQRLGELGDYLARHVAWWKPRPFIASGALPWVADAPEVERWLMTLGHDDLDAIEAAGCLPASAPALLHTFEAEVQALVAVPALASSPVDRATAAHVPGRKRLQIEGLVDNVQASGPIVDWCGGKGHLGRSLGHRHRQPVTVIEHVAAYADEARALAAKLEVALTFVAADVLDPRVDVHLGPGVLGIGLHACGALGVRLLQAGVARGAASVVLAPCCLHKDTWRALSVAGARCDPGIDHSALRLATSDEVVAPPRLRTARRRENAWRLGLDHLLREASGHDVYTPLGTLPSELLREPFEVFCRAVAELRGLDLPASWSPQAMEALAHRQALAARALGLVRGAFRRALELWVVFDRATYLEEHGLAVDVATFCARAVSPRNLLIRGCRASVR